MNVVLDESFSHLPRHNTECLSTVNRLIIRRGKAREREVEGEGRREKVDIKREIVRKREGGREGGRES